MPRGIYPKRTSCQAICTESMARAGTGPECQKLRRSPKNAFHPQQAKSGRAGLLRPGFRVRCFLPARVPICPICPIFFIFKGQKELLAGPAHDRKSRTHYAPVQGAVLNSVEGLAPVGLLGGQSTSRVQMTNRHRQRVGGIGRLRRRG